MKKQYKAVFSNGQSMTRTTNNNITLGWCVMLDQHILFKGFSCNRDKANLEITRKMNTITGRGDITSMQPYIKNRVALFDRRHGVGAFEQSVCEEEKKYKTEIVKVRVL